MIFFFVELYKIKSEYGIWVLPFALGGVFFILGPLLFDYNSGNGNSDSNGNSFDNNIIHNFGKVVNKKIFKRETE